MGNYIDEAIDQETFSFSTSLNDKLWGVGNTLKDGLREKLAKIGMLFFESLKLPETVKPLDITFTGSLAGYNYTSHSDLDIHIIIDYAKIGLENSLVMDYMKLKKDAWEENYDITVFGYPVELFAQDFEHYQASESPTYSLIEDKWIVEPSGKKPKIDKATITKKAESIMGTIDSMVSSHDHEERLCMAKVVMDKIKRLRAQGMENGGDYSTENLIFKALRNGGYLQKLSDIKSDSIEKLYSIKRQSKD